MQTEIVALAEGSVQALDAVLGPGDDCTAIDSQRWFLAWVHNFNSVTDCRRPVTIVTANSAMHKLDDNKIGARASHGLRRDLA